MIWLHICHDYLSEISTSLRGNYWNQKIAQRKTYEMGSRKCKFSLPDVKKIITKTKLILIASMMILMKEKIIKQMAKYRKSEKRMEESGKRAQISCQDISFFDTEESQVTWTVEKKEGQSLVFKIITTIITLFFY